MVLAVSPFRTVNVFVVMLSCLAGAASATPVQNGSFDETTPSTLPPGHPDAGDPDIDPLKPVGWNVSAFDNWPDASDLGTFMNGAYVTSVTGLGGTPDGPDNVLALRNRGAAWSDLGLYQYQRVVLTWNDASVVTGYDPAEPLASYQVLVNGSIVGEFTPDVGNGWATRSLTTPTSKGGFDIMFVGKNLGETGKAGGFGQYTVLKAMHTVYIDDVQWDPVPISPVPEPSQALLALLGLSVLTYRTRKSARPAGR